MCLSSLTWTPNPSSSFPPVISPCYDSTPIFPLFSLTWPHMPLVSHATYPHAPSICLQITELILAHCTHVHYPICPCPCLVPYSCAAASYHVPLTCSSMTHLPPLVLYTFPIWYAFWSPSTSQIHHVLPPSEALGFFPWSSTILSFVYCFTFHTQIQTQTLPCI